jgi:hypothetical protein
MSLGGFHDQAELAPIRPFCQVAGECQGAQAPGPSSQGHVEGFGAFLSRCLAGSQKALLEGLSGGRGNPRPRRMPTYDVALTSALDLPAGKLR